MSLVVVNYGIGLIFLKVLILAEELLAKVEAVLSLKS